MDLFENFTPGLDAPVSSGFDIIPDDNNDLAVFTRTIYVGQGGDITAILVGDAASVTYKDVPQGTWQPIRAKRILTTGTTAAFLIGHSR